jgi:hypothetical protein
MTFYIKNCSERYYATVPIVMTKLFDKNDRQATVQVEGSYLVNHSEFHRGAIEQGLGIGSLPDYIAKQGIKTGKLIPL